MNHHSDRPRLSRGGCSAVGVFALMAMLVGGCGERADEVVADGEPEAVPVDAASVDAQPVEARIDELETDGRLQELTVTEQTPSGQWVDMIDQSGDVITLTAIAPAGSDADGRLLALVAGRSTPEADFSGFMEADPTDDTFCVAVETAVSCGPLVDPWGDLLPWADGEVWTMPSAVGDSDDFTVATSVDDRSGAWLLVSGLPPDVALLELSVADAPSNESVGQVPIDGVAALGYADAFSALSLIGYDSNNQVVWSDEVEPESGGGFEAVNLDDYAGLVPPGAALGPRWTDPEPVSFNGFRFDETVVPECADGDSFPKFKVVEGLYAEYGIIDHSPDDAALIIIKEAVPDLDTVYQAFTSPDVGLNCDSKILDELAADNIPGALGVMRVLAEDELGQVSDQIVVRRQDMVLFMNTAADHEGVDLGELVGAMLSEYDAD